MSRAVCQTSEARDWPDSPSGAGHVCGKSWSWTSTGPGEMDGKQLVFVTVLDLVRTQIKCSCLTSDLSSSEKHFAVNKN